MEAMEQEKYGVLEKCRAVLAVWTERQKSAGVCRELDISPSLLCQWQDRAVSGMLEALEPRGQERGEGPALGQQLKRLLDRKVRYRELMSVGRSPRKVRESQPLTQV